MKSLRSYLTALDRTQHSFSNRELETNSIPSSRHQRLYRALLATTFVAGSQLVAMMSANANPIPTPDQPSPIVPTRVILNGSFEQPVFKNTGAGYGVNESYNNPSPGLPVIWRTTEPGNANGTYKDQLEIWRGVNTSAGGQTATSGEGQQYAEINASTNASIYQDICVLPNENVQWSLLHAARIRTSANPTNKMQVSITNPTIWANGKTPPATKLYNSVDLSTSYSQGWQSKTGSWLSSNTTIQPLRFAFQAIQGSDGDISYGNFIDDVKLNLSALVDFLPSNGGGVNLTSTTEGNPDKANPPYYYLSLRVNGIMDSQGSVKITLTGLDAKRDFTLGSVLKGNTAGVGFTATKAGNVITLTIPAGTYDANVASNYIHIPIDFSDTIKEPNDNLTFTLSTPTGGGGSKLADLSIGSTTCGTLHDKVNVVLTDDDVEFQKKV
jgi:hypothetical protein